MTILQSNPKSQGTSVARKVFVETDDFDGNLSDLPNDNDVSAQEAFQAVDSATIPVTPDPQTATNTVDIATNADDISTNSGNIATNADDISTNADDIADIGVWQAWTPTWTNLTVGNGTVTARYTQIGKTVHFTFTITFGTTTETNSPPSYVEISLPVTAHSIYDETLSGIPFGYGILYNESGSEYGTGALRTVSSTKARVSFMYDNGYTKLSSAYDGGFTSWTVDDVFAYSGTYEAA